MYVLLTDDEIKNLDKKNVNKIIKKELIQILDCKNIKVTKTTDKITKISIPNIENFSKVRIILDRYEKHHDIKFTFCKLNTDDKISINKLNQVVELLEKERQDKTKKYQMSDKFKKVKFKQLYKNIIVNMYYCNIEELEKTFASSEYEDLINFNITKEEHLNFYTNSTLEQKFNISEFIKQYELKDLYQLFLNKKTLLYQPLNDKDFKYVQSYIKTTLDNIFNFGYKHFPQTEDEYISFFKTKKIIENFNALSIKNKFLIFKNINKKHNIDIDYNNIKHNFINLQNDLKGQIPQNEVDINFLNKKIEILNKIDRINNIIKFKNMDKKDKTKYIKECVSHIGKIKIRHIKDGIKIISDNNNDIRIVDLKLFHLEKILTAKEIHNIIINDENEIIIKQISEIKDLQLKAELLKRRI